MSLEKGHTDLLRRHRSLLKEIGPAFLVTASCLVGDGPEEAEPAPQS